MNRANLQEFFTSMNITTLKGVGSKNKSFT